MSSSTWAALPLPFAPLPGLRAHLHRPALKKQLHHGLLLIVHGLMQQRHTVAQAVLEGRVTHSAQEGLNVLHSSTAQAGGGDGRLGG